MGTTWNNSGLWRCGTPRESYEQAFLSTEKRGGRIAFRRVCFLSASAVFSAAFLPSRRHMEAVSEHTVSGFL